MGDGEKSAAGLFGVFVPPTRNPAQSQDSVSRAEQKWGPKNLSSEVEMIFGETDESSPFVYVEQMMPFLSFVRAKNIDRAIKMACKSEHGFKHTSIIHSNHVVHMTKMGKAMETTPVVKNGPCMAGLGLGGEGYCSMIDSLRILGK
jgi:tRNA(Phe) wybutosine-synthesizing methylase Tyw3